MTHKGREQVVSHFDVIKKTIDGGSLYIVSSTAPRARMSAEILADEFGVTDIDFESYLWSAGDGPDENYCFDLDESRLLGIVGDRRNKADGLIVVSHLEVARDLPGIFMKSRGLDYHHFGLSKKGDLHYIDILKGSNTLYRATV